jgi:hypothetical protein
MKKSLAMNSAIFANFTELLIPRFFKILPLFEESNEGLQSYVESLMFEMNGLYWTIEEIQANGNYLSLLATLESICDEIAINDEYSQAIIKREVFRSIEIIKQLKPTVESGE